MKPEIRKRMCSDFGGFIRDVRGQVKVLSSRVRKGIYEVAEHAAAAIEHLLEHEDEFQAFLKDPYFKRSRKRVKRPGPAVLQYINEADEISRERYSRHGLAVELLLLQGVAPDEIADQLSEQGGIMAVLDQRFDIDGDEAVAGDEGEELEPDESVDDERNGDEADDDSEDVDQEPRSEGREQRAKEAASEQSRRSQAELQIPRLETGFTYFCMKVRDEHMSRFTEVGTHDTTFEVLEGTEFRIAVPLSLDGEDLTDVDEA